jgi:hypothetical protein
LENGLTKRPLSGQYKRNIPIEIVDYCRVQSQNASVLPTPTARNRASSITECLCFTNANGEKSSKSNRIIRFSPVTPTCPSAFLQSPHLLRQTISTRRTCVIRHTVHGSPHHLPRPASQAKAPPSAWSWPYKRPATRGLSNQGDDKLARPRFSVT